MNLKNIAILFIAALMSFSSASWGMSCIDVFAGKGTNLSADERMPESYSRGQEEIEHFVKIAERLRSQSIDPKATHIQEFADLIDPHLRFAKSAIENQGAGDKAKRLQLLNEFWREAHQKQSSGQVTYRWWIIFNFRLSILLTPKNKRTVERGGYPDEFIVAVYKADGWKTEADMDAVISSFPTGGYFDPSTIDSLIQKFPAHIIFPTIVGDIGVSVLNRVFSTGVHPFGLVPDRLMADGREMYPDHFFGHDAVHLENELFSFKRWDDPDLVRAVQRFHNKYLRMIGTLPVRERLMVEFVYFITTHELTLLADGMIRGDASEVTNNLFGTRLDKMVTDSMDDTWFGGFVPSWVNQSSKKDVKNFLIEAGRVFNKFAARINSIP